MTEGEREREREGRREGGREGGRRDKENEQINLITCKIKNNNQYLIKRCYGC